MCEENNKNTEFEGGSVNESEAFKADAEQNTPKEEGTQPVNNGAVPPPYNRPPVYSQNGYTPYGNGNYNQGYNPYSQNRPNPVYSQYQPYTPPVPKPEAPKKPSKGKKKGVKTAVIIVVCIFVLSLIVAGVSLVKGNSSGNNNNTAEEGTKLDFAATPEKTDGTGENGELSSGDVYKKVYESSVGIIVYTGSRQTAASEGSGIVMGATGDGKGTYIITCAHVVNITSPKVVVQTHDGEQYEATVIGIDLKTDIGLLRVNTTKLKAAEFANSDTLSVGDTIYAIGNPGGTQFFGSFTNGMVSAIDRPVDSPVGYEVACIQHTAAINPGNSGGALVNEFGQVVGINSSKIASKEYEGMGFSVPSATVKEIVDQLIKNGAVTNRPALGIKFASVSSSQAYSIIARSNDLPAGTIVIESIMEGSDLKNQNVKSGDMIIAVNGKELESYNALLDIIDKSSVGDKIKLTIARVNADYKVDTFDIETKIVSDTVLTTEESTNKNQGFSFPFNQ